MPTLVPKGPPDDSGRTVFEPIVAEVTRFSDYNPEQFALSGVDGFWSLTPKLKEKMGIPVKGTKALWTLSHKAKTGPKAKPGSVYCDVLAANKVPADYQPDVDELPFEEHPVDTGIRTEKALTAPAQGQDMSDAEANLYLRLHELYAAHLAAKPLEPWNTTNAAIIAAKAIERESIERQQVMRTDGEIIAAALPTLWGDQGQTELTRLFARYNRLADLLAHLPAPEPMPAAQQATDAESLAWDDEPKEKTP